MINLLMRSLKYPHTRRRRIASARTSTSTPSSTASAPVVVVPLSGLLVVVQYVLYTELCIYMQSTQLQVCKYIYMQQVLHTYRAQQWPQNMRTHVARHALLPHPSFSVDLVYIVYIHTDDVYCIILIYYISIYVASSI